jgi:hypothetical protein
MTMAGSGAEPPGVGVLTNGSATISSAEPWQHSP